MWLASSSKDLSMLVLYFYLTLECFTKVQKKLFSWFHDVLIHYIEQRRHLRIVLWIDRSVSNLMFRRILLGTLYLYVDFWLYYKTHIIFFISMLFWYSYSSLCCNYRVISKSNYKAFKFKNVRQLVTWDSHHTSVNTTLKIFLIKFIKDFIRHYNTNTSGHKRPRGKAWKCCDTLISYVHKGF